jgi:hypothetical protein
MKTNRVHRGIATVWMAVAGLGLVGLFSLVLDLARVRYTQHQLQIAADAAALAVVQNPIQTIKQQAAARALGAKTAGYNIAANGNVIIDPAADIVLGTYDSKTQVFTATNLSPNAAQVTARRTSGSPGGALKLMFGAFWGTAMSDVSATAIALAQAQSPPGIYLLDPTAGPELTMTGDTKLDVVNGTVQVDSSASNAVTLSGNAVVDASAINVVGSMIQTGSTSVGKVNQGAPSLPDPLASLETPDVPRQSLPNPTGATTDPMLVPGYYANQLVFTGNAHVVLKHGLYILGNGIIMTGNTSLDASAGAMLYAVSGPITLTGNGGIKLTTMLDGTGYENIGIYMDRKNNSDVTITGDGGAEVGTVYAPASKVTLTGESRVSEIGIVTLIAAKATITGTANVTVDAQRTGGAPNPVTLVK